MLVRKLGRVERIGWLAFGAALIVALAALQLGGRTWVVDGALGLALLLSIPLMVVSIRGQWRGE